jgi:hypothetical protein
VTEHRELSSSLAIGLRLHVVESKPPAPAPDRLNVTVPDGFDPVPPSVSSTVAVQMLA